MNEPKRLVVASTRLVVDLPQRDADTLDRIVASTESNRKETIRKALALLDLVMQARADNKDVLIGDERVIIL